MPEVLGLHPVIVILEFGGNDGLRGLPVSTTKANLARMIAEFQKAGMKVLLAGMTLPPNYGPDYIASFNRVYVDLESVPLIDGEHLVWAKRRINTCSQAAGPNLLVMQQVVGRIIGRANDRDSEFLEDLMHSEVPELLVRPGPHARRGLLI